MFKLVCGLALIVLSPSLAVACNAQTGERIQLAYFSWGAESLPTVIEGEEQFGFTRLPNGQKLSVRLKPASQETYEEQFQWRAHNAELVEVEIFDVTSEPERLVYKSLAGANSSSAVSSPALSADALANLRLNLEKPLCVSAGSQSRGSGNGS